MLAFASVTPAEIQAARKALRLTAKDLATALGVDVGTVQSWETGNGFPTKKRITQIQRLIAEKSTSKPVKKSPEPGASRFEDPAYWALIQRLATDEPLYLQVLALASK